MGKVGALNTKKLSSRKRQEADQVAKKNAAEKEMIKILEPNTTKILKHLQLKNYEKCLKKIEKFLDVSTDKAKISQVILIRAVCWTFLDMNEEETLESIEKILRDEPQNPFAFFARGLFEYRNCKLELSIKSLDKAIELHPSKEMIKGLRYKANAEEYLKVIAEGKNLITNADLALAIRKFNSSVLIDQSNKKMIKYMNKTCDNYILQVITLIERNTQIKLPDKFDVIEKMILNNELLRAQSIVSVLYSMTPREARTYYISGLLLFRYGNFKKSLSCFHEALKMDSSLEKAKQFKLKTEKLFYLCQKITKLMNDDQYTEAAALIRTALQIDDKSDIVNQVLYFKRAICHFNLKLKTLAVNDLQFFILLRKLIEENIEGPNIVTSLGIPDVDDIPGSIALATKFYKSLKLARAQKKDISFKTLTVNKFETLAKILNVSSCSESSVGSID